MKFIILKKNLKDGLRSIEKISAENSNLPILKNFIIESFDNKIKISATNLELATTAFIAGKIIEEGGTTIPLNVFNSIINNIYSERINLELLENNKLLIKTDNYQAEIQGIKKEEFPIIPKIENIKNYIKIQNSFFLNSLTLIINSIATNSRPELAGALFDFQTTILKLTTTDTFRLSEKTIINTQFESNIDKNFKIIIPIKTLQEVAREIQNNEEGKIEIYFDQNQILFKTENTEIISRLINGEFPDYQQIIPKTIDFEITLNTEEFINAIKLSSIFTDRFNEIKILLKENSKNIEIFSFGQNIGENRYLIPAKIKCNLSGDFETAFNWKFLLDGAKNIKSENIFLGLNNSNKPAIIKSPEDNSWFYIIMPIKG